MSGNNNKDKVTILMATYQGGSFLNEQLESISCQSHTNWKLVVSDDGSTDATWDLLTQYQSQWPKGKVELRKGPGSGFCRNFLSIACDPGLSTKYYAFSDQDDIWNTGKLSHAIAFLESFEETKPALYCGRTLAVDEVGNSLWLSTHFKRPPSFRNALVQNIAGGNTMVFNEAARKLIANAGSTVNVPSHDWWLYILVTGHGGVVKYDTTPLVEYRQHKNNLVGSNRSVFARFLRIQRLFRGNLKNWTDLNLKALGKCSDLLSTENKAILFNFHRLRHASMIERLVLFWSIRLYRQTTLDQLGLLMAVIIRRL